jgi:hypothetical protein
MKSKLSTTMQRSLLTATLLAILALLTPARGAEVDDNIYNYLQVLRSDFNSAKVELINKIMKLSADEAQKFWPIYRQYENELAQMAVGRAELIAEFVKSHQDGTFDNPRADDIASRWFKGQRARLDLMEKYHKKVKKTLTPIRAGQFLQIEHQLGIFIDMTIAAEMPLVGEKSK